MQMSGVAAVVLSFFFLPEKEKQVRRSLIVILFIQSIALDTTLCRIGHVVVGSLRVIPTLFYFSQGIVSLVHLCCRKVRFHGGGSPDPLHVRCDRDPRIR